MQTCLGVQLIERKTIDTQKEVKSKGRQIFRNASVAVRNVPWQNVVKNKTVPVFINDFAKLLKQIVEEKQPLTSDIISRFSNESKLLWNYVNKIDPQNKKIYSVFERETNNVEEVWKTYGDSFLSSFRWISKGLLKFVINLMDVIKIAVIEMGSRVGLILNQMFDRGHQIVIETILYSFTAIMEVTISNPSATSGYAKSIGVEMFSYLSAIDKKYYLQLKPVADTTDNYDIVQWFAIAMKNLEMVTLSGMQTIMMTCIESLNSILEYITDMLSPGFDIATYETEVKELKEFAQELSEDENILQERRDALSVAIQNMDKQSNYLPKNGVVSPHLVALLLRQIYYRQTPDTCVGKRVVEQRLGSAAEEITTRLFEAHELLRIEIQLALRNTSVAAENIEGFWNWCGGKKKKPLKDDDDDNKDKKELKEETPEELESRLKLERIQREKTEREARAEANGLFDIPPNDAAYNAKELELMEELEKAQNDLNRIRGAYGRDIEELNNNNNTYTVRAVQEAREQYRSGKGKTQQISRRLKVQTDLGKQAVLQIGYGGDLQDLVNQIQWELRYIRRQRQNIEHTINTRQNRYFMYVLGLIMFGGFFYSCYYFMEQLGNACGTSWDKMGEAAQATGNYAIFQLWKDFYDENTLWYMPNMVQAVLRPPSPMLLRKIAANGLHELNTYVDAGYGPFMDFIYRYSVAIQDIAVTATNEEIKVLANFANSAIQTAASNPTAPAAIRENAVVAIKTIISASNSMFFQGQIPSTLQSIIGALRNDAAAVLGGVSAAWRHFYPSPGSYVSPTGFLKLVTDGANENMVTAVKSLFKAYINIGLGFPATLVVCLFGICRWAATYSTGAFNMVPQTGIILTGTIAALDVIVNQMFEVIKTGAADVSTAQAFRIASILGIAAWCFGFSPWGWVAGMLQRAAQFSRSRVQGPLPVLPPPATPQPTNPIPSLQPAPIQQPPSYTVTDQQYERALVAREQELQVNARQPPPIILNNNNETTSEEEEEEEEDKKKKTYVPPARLKSCIICSNQSAFICSHCDTNQYCSRACARKDWSVIQKDHVSLLKKK